MGFFSKAGKLLIYPISRPIADIRKSGRGIKASFDLANERRRKRAEDAMAASQYLAGKTPNEKFEEVFALNGWTDEALAEQFKAARNTRRGMLALVALTIPLMLFLLIKASFLVLAVLGTMLVILMAGCVAVAARFAWWEWQISERAIYPLAVFLARQDLFKRVLLP